MLVRAIVSKSTGFESRITDLVRTRLLGIGKGRTGHAETVQIVCDPSRVSCGQLLHEHFPVAHDPTQLNRQGPGEGTQYRSTIFT